MHVQYAGLATITALYIYKIFWQIYVVIFALPILF